MKIKNHDFYMTFLHIIVAGLGLLLIIILFVVNFQVAYSQWDSKPDYRQCEMTDFVNNKIEFTCKNDLKIIRNFNDFTSGDWSIFRDKNNCRLVKIDETVSKNQNQWLCDNNINISNDFYK